MKILVDTSIWSVALRHSISTDETDEIKEQLYSLIEDSRVAMIGPIRQELLSGVKSQTQFNRLKKRLEPFRDIPMETNDYILAAKFFNRCRSKGIQGSHIDFLICAVSSRKQFPLFTIDKDFGQYKKHLDFILFKELKR
ncbi:MAG: PIN domain-containing protein [Balneolaceae bacterium]|nr:PIN domain-containing protein [Balneolaceae bacterium]